MVVLASDDKYEDWDGVDVVTESHPHLPRNFRKTMGMIKAEGGPWECDQCGGPSYTVYRCSKCGAER